MPILDITDDDDLDGLTGSSRCWEWLPFIAKFRFLFDVDEIPDGDDVWAEINDDDDDKPRIICVYKQRTGLIFVIDLTKTRCNSLCLLMC